jgi:hypothetical protein
MSIHRGMTAAAVALTLVLAGCDGGSDPDPAPTVTTSGTSSTSTATADPVEAIVPLAGEKDAPLDWTLGNGVDAEDPAVNVARQFQTLWLVAPLSAEWSDEAKLSSAAAALTDGKVLTSDKIDEWSSGDKTPAKAPVRLLVQGSETEGTTATVWTCVDPNAALGLDDTGSALVQIKLAVLDGAWKVTSYDQNTPGAPERVRACNDFDGA